MTQGFEAECWEGFCLLIPFMGKQISVEKLDLENDHTVHHS